MITDIFLFLKFLKSKFHKFLELSIGPNRLGRGISYINFSLPYFKLYSGISLDRNIDGLTHAVILWPSGKIIYFLSLDKDSSVIKIFLITGIKYYKLKNLARFLFISFSNVFQDPVPVHCLIKVNCYE